MSNPIFSSEAAKNLWKSPRLIFRAVEHSDEPFLAEINTNSLNLVNLAYFLPHPQNHKDIQGFREYLENALVGVLICLPDEKWKGNDKPKPIGALTLSQDPKYSRHRNAIIGINILGEFQGKGYGSEAIKWVLEYAFMTIGLHRVGIGCFEYNDGARRLYEDKLFFKREAYRRECVYSQGQWWGVYEQSMLEHEWRELKKSGAL